MDSHQERRKRLSEITPRFGVRPSHEELAILHEERAEKAEARNLKDDLNSERIAPRYERRAADELAAAENAGHIAVRSVGAEAQQVPVNVEHESKVA